jgi:hypothetical protein
MGKQAKKRFLNKGIREALKKAFSESNKNLTIKQKQEAFEIARKQAIVELSLQKKSV